jgi:hypothetical protein
MLQFFILDDRPAKGIHISNPGVARGRGRPKIRWEDGVMMIARSSEY